MKRRPWLILATIGVFAFVATVELCMGRLPLGPDGRFGWWEGDIWSDENSQRFADPYSFSHLVHGMLFSGLLWLVARRWPVRYRFLIALALEAGWELLENSPLIIHRYREATVALGYAGDSVLNSLSDILMMVIGFGFAFRARLWITLATVMAMEAGGALWARANVTLNTLML